MVSALENAQNVATNVAIARCFIKISWSFNGIDSEAFKKIVSENTESLLVYVHSYYNVKELRKWKVQIEKWCECDGIVMRNAAIEISSAISVRTC